MSTHDHDHAHGHDDHGHGDGHHGPTHFWSKYIFSTDHKIIGIQFLLSSLLFVILGGLLALGVRYQLAWPMQDVPYAKLLPQNMTSPAPEGNLTLWNDGHKLTVEQPIELEGVKVPAGAVAYLHGFPQGVAVTIPAGTVIQENGVERTLTAPLDATVARSLVMGHYNYNARQGRVIPGTPVKTAEGKEITVVATEILEPGAKTPTRVARHILLDVRSDATVVSIKVPPQKVPAEPVEGKPQVDVSGGEIVAAPAAALTYTKQTLTTQAYLQLFTMHASVMIFFVIIPSLVGGFGNFAVPIMIGARDMAFPKLNALSFWISIPSGLLMLLSFWTMGGSAFGGWTMYPTLSTKTYAVDMGTTLWVAGVLLVGFSSVVGALNYVTTIINMRAPGMGMFRMPLTVWSILITATLALFATPVLTAAMVLLMLDRTLGTMFFSPVMQTVADGATTVRVTGGQPLMWQHLFWFYSHPAVYIMILPAMGVVSDVLATFSRKPIFGYKPMVFAICGIAGLGFIVWGHHMFQSGMNPVLGTTFMASTIMIAVPSAIKTFNWLGTLWGGNIKFTPAMLNALGFVSMFVIGGLSGIFMASAPVDIYIHDTYFIVAHIHYVLFGGSIFGIFAGVYYWFPKMFGRQLNQRWGVIHFWMNILAFNLTFFTMHVLGVGGHPRRYASIMEYPTLQHLQPMNVLMTIGAMMLGMAQIPFFYNFFRCMPRKLGRAMAASFAVALTAPAVMGLTAWNLWQGSDTIIGKTFYSLVGMIPAAGDVPAHFSNTQVYLGYILLIGAIVVISGLMFKSYTAGPRWAIACSVLPVLALIVLVMSLGTGKMSIGPDSSFAGLLEWLKYGHTGLVAMGLGVPYILLVVAITWGVWALGGQLRVPRILELLLYPVFLPLFLAPVLLKHDFYMWIGMPSLIEMSWLILALTALPGLAYVVLCRPQDEYAAIPGDNPWHANSLEWCTTSPPPFTNFDAIPTVYRGAYEYSSPVVKEDYLTQTHVLPPGVVEPSGH